MVKQLIIAASLLIAVSLSSASKNEARGVLYDAEITRVLDGDTVAFKASWLPDPLKKELSLRVFGVDTPEKNPRAKCESENLKAQAASGFTKKLIESSAKRQIVLISWDKYGGRVLGDVILDGKSLRALLIQYGHAREYFGEAKQSWC
jgi:endonuclease YncB( thermonuclease family)